jgi:hypothetical protein
LNAIARYSDTSGSLIDSSSITIIDTGLVSGVLDPVSAQEAVTKAYVDDVNVRNTYTTAGLPTAVGVTGKIIYISDEGGNGKIAVSNGTTWIRVTMEI